MRKATRIRRATAIILALVAALWAVPSGAAVQVQIECLYTIDGEESLRDGFSVVATNEQGKIVTEAGPGETISFTAACPEDYYIMTWTWVTQTVDDTDASPDLNWEISEDVSVLTITLGEEFTMTSLEATAQFAAKPPTEGAVDIELTALASNVPQGTADKVELTASNEINVPLTSADPGQDVFVTADVPGGYYVHSWNIVSVTSAGEDAVAANALEWNEVAFTIPVDASEIRVEATIESGVAFSALCACNGQTIAEGASVKVTDARGEAVQCLKVGEPVTIRPSVPADYTFDTVSFYTSPAAGAQVDSYLAVETNKDDPLTVTVTLKDAADLNAVVAILNYTRPVTFAIVVKPEGSGTVRATPDDPEPGDTVRVEASPAEGNTFAGWTTEGPEWLDVIGPTDDSRGTFSFVMPDEDVTVFAYFTNAKTALDEAIVQAEQVLSSIFVSSNNGADCPKDMLWTTPEQAEALSQTIEDARVVAADPRGAYTEAQEILEEVVVAFMNSAQEGTADTMPVQVTEINGLRVVRGLTLSPETGTSVAVSELKAALEARGAAVTIRAADGSALAAGATCATGMLVSWNDGAPDATVVVDGDVSGTGRISLSQLVQMARAYAGTQPLEGAYYIAGDFSGSGKIGLTDLVKEAQLFSAYRNQEHSSVDPNPENTEPPVGQWVIPQDPAVTDTMREELAGAAGLPSMDDTIYDPVACLGTQSASGTNYRILLTKTEKDKPATYVIFTMHADQEEGATITSVEESDASVPSFETGALGGWIEPESPAVPAGVVEAMKEADAGAVPIALLGSQVVAGMNYLVCCEQGDSFEILQVYSDVRGGAEVTARYSFVNVPNFAASTNPTH